MALVFLYSKTELNKCFFLLIYWGDEAWKPNPTQPTNAVNPHIFNARRETDLHPQHNIDFSL